jgi:hypothetical protein
MVMQKLLYLIRRSCGTRARTLLALALVCVLAPGSAARTKAPRLRAIALVEVAPAAAGKAEKARVIPLVILDEEKYNDAAVYKATPVPMAVEPGVVYELQHEGMVVGEVTIDRAVQDAMGWYGEGHRQIEAAKPAHHADSAAMGDDDAPPRLHRGKAEPEEPHSVDIPAKTAAPPPHIEDDPNRPILRRGAGEQVQAQPDTNTGHSKPQAESAAKTAAKPAAPAQMKTYVAVSDEVSGDPRPYAFPWKPEEQARLTRAMEELARKEIAKQLTPPAPAPKKRGTKAKPATAPPLPLENESIHAYDLDTTNDAELVLTASAPWQGRSGPMKAYITLVGRVDYAGEPKTIFSSVTDDEHLDLAGRMELVDAVDADGDNRGELLFRRIGQDTRGYELYRVGRDQMWLIFSNESGGE